MKRLKHVVTRLRGSRDTRKDNFASPEELLAAHALEPRPSRDWTKLSNILRRSGGAFSHLRKAH